MRFEVGLPAMQLLSATRERVIIKASPLGEGDRVSGGRGLFAQTISFSLTTSSVSAAMNLIADHLHTASTPSPTGEGLLYHSSTYPNYPGLFCEKLHKESYVAGEKAFEAFGLFGYSVEPLQVMVNKKLRCAFFCSAYNNFATQAATALNNKFFQNGTLSLMP